jgi:hypothetical protein
MQGFLATSLLTLAGVALLTTMGAASFPANQKRRPQPPSKTNSNIRPCPRRAVANYLLAEFLQCWFEAPHGRWRTLYHEFHYTNLVVEVEAASLDDAHEITARWVRVHREKFSEILVYVQAESGAETSLIRRVRWTRANGYETLEYMGSLRR